MDRCPGEIPPFRIEMSLLILSGLIQNKIKILLKPCFLTRSELPGIFQASPTPKNPLKINTIFFF